nr:3-ketoacyl-CoA thiolase 2, peroxisomal [Tanacetum cinerariifolium]
MERGDFSSCGSLTGFDSRDPFDLGIMSEAPRFTLVVSKTPVSFSSIAKDVIAGPLLGLAEIDRYLSRKVDEIHESSYQTPLCKTETSGLKDTYPDDILAPVMKVCSYRSPLCKTKKGGIKDTYPDDILAPIMKAVVDVVAAIKARFYDIDELFYFCFIRKCTETNSVCLLFETAQLSIALSSLPWIGSFPKEAADAAATAYGKSKDKIIPIKGR